MLFREIKEYLSKWWDIINTMFNSLSVIFQWINVIIVNDNQTILPFYIIKAMSVLPKLTYSFKMFLIKISGSVFVEYDKQFLKVKWKYKNTTRIYWSIMVNQIKEYLLNRILHNNENNKLQLHAMWVKLRNIMLSKRCQIQTTVYNFISINVKNNSFWNQNSVCYIWGLGNNYLTQRDFCGFSNFLFLELCVCYFWGIQLIFTQSW